jgi:divalent metal cation (Fe/Co/Zn/Cd) transporter
METEIVSRVNEFIPEADCHRVAIWEEGRGLTVTLHCSLDPTLSVEEAHDLSERLEGYLCDEVPSLQRVVIHVEPPRKPSLKG